MIGLPGYRAASALLLLLPETPLIFMGQEWAATTPFLYFTDHHAELGRAVTEGRRAEFAAFSAFADPAARDRIPDPQSPETMKRSRLHWDERDAMPHVGIWRLHRELLATRRDLGPNLLVEALDADSLALRRSARAGGELLLVVRLRGAGTVQVSGTLVERGRWRPARTTEDASFADDGRVPAVEVSAGRVTVHFDRPAAVLLRG